MIGNKYYHLFPLKWQVHLLISEKISANIQIWKISLSVNCPFKLKEKKKKQPIYFNRSSQLNNHNHAFSWKTTTLQHAAELLYMYFARHHT